MRIITLISLCDCIANASVLNGVPSDPDWCVLQAFAQQCFFAGSWLWTAILTYLLYSMVLYGKISLLEWQMHLIVWTLCITASVVPLATSHSYDITQNPDDDWCWIQLSTRANTHSAFIWPVFISNCFVFGTFLLMLFWGTCILYKAKIQQLPMKNSVKTALRFLFRYPLILVVTWFPGSILLTVKPHTPQGASSLIAIYCLATWQGGLTAIAFFSSSRESRKCWYQLFVRFFRCLSCCYKNVSDLESDLLASIRSSYQSEEGGEQDFESDDTYYGRKETKDDEEEDRSSRFDQSSVDSLKFSMEDFKMSTISVKF
jgi:hypothetical protein